jgi:hypothetical protein
LFHVNTLLGKFGGDFRPDSVNGSGLFAAPSSFFFDYAIGESLRI